MTSSFTTTLVWMTLSILVSFSGAENNGGSNNHHGINNNHYSVARQISLDPTHNTVNVEGETESVAFYEDDEDNDEKKGYRRCNDESKRPSLFLPHSSSNSCGGAFVAMAECSFPAYNLYDDSDLDEDDDDDDDDDGHSSMLSNASFRRSLVSVNVDNELRSTSKPIRKNLHNTSSGRYFSNVQHNGSFLPTHSYTKYANYRNPEHFRDTKPHDVVLNLRGGASKSLLSSIFLDEFSKRLLTAALVTLLYEGSMGHVLEYMKVVSQTSPPGTSYMSILQNITKEKGLLGVYDGFLPWGFLQATMKGGVFGFFHAIAKSNLEPLTQNGLPQLLALTLAGGIAGGFQGYVLSPILLLKTRVMTNPVFRERMGLIETTLKSFTIGIDVVKKEGIFALMKGANTFALKRVFDWSTRYYFSDYFESLLLSIDGGNKLSPGKQIVSSLLGGTLSTLVTLPLDVIVAKSQDAKKANVNESAWRIFMKDYEEGGWKGLYDANMQGFEARLAHVCFTTVVMKTGAPLMYDFLFGNE